MKLNATDGGKRKFILVTNNENEICEKVTYERLKRVIAKEGYAARLKYYKIDYVPIDEKVYYEYANDLLKHTRELVELENGVDFGHDQEIAIVLTDAEAAKLSSDARRLAKCKAVYVGHDVLLSNDSENIDIFAPKKAEALKRYCAKHHLRGGFVCHSESEDELFLFEGGFSEDVNDPGWKLLNDIV